MPHRSAFTRLELVIVLGIITLLLAILAPTLRRARDLAKRQKCADIVKAIGTGLYILGNNSSDAELWRGQVDWPDQWRQHGGETLSIEYTQSIGSYRTQNLTKTDASPERLSTTRGLWLIIRGGWMSSAQFLCPATGDIESPDMNPKNSFDFGTGAVRGPISKQRAAQFWHQVSYGYQVPFGRFGTPSLDRDMRMILLADKGPFGAAVDAGLTTPPAFPNTGLPADWRPWNSPNHNGEGQTVMYVDSHAEFLKTPLTPSNSDDIYTCWSGSTNNVLERSHGLAPAPGLKLVPLSNTDSLLYP